MICPLCNGTGRVDNQSKLDIIRHMIEGGKTYRDIAPVVELSIGTISYHAKRMGLARDRLVEDVITDEEAKDVMAEKDLP